MEYKVTTQQLVTTYPSHKPAPNQALVATYPSHKQAATAKLVTTYPSHKQAHTTTLETTGVHRREYDPYGDFNFIVEIDGVSAGAFEKCDGLSWELDVIQYRFNEDPWGRLRRGQDSYGRIKLTKGYTTSSALWDWCNEIMGGGFGRKTGAVYLLNDAAETVATYRWVEGFPCKWSGFRFDGKSSGSHSVEEIEIAVEKIIRG
jgi:phage tail-like protein